MSQCNLCPRACGVDRDAGQVGRCHADATVRVARASLHMWEEPCISGTRGSGTVFFTGCNLGCVYCQNFNIADGTNGTPVSESDLASIFLRLQDMGANNINLVTPSHFVPQVVSALEQAKSHGLTLPIVYNTSSYESVSTLSMLDGLVDVYLPDLKYRDPRLSEKYSFAPDYFHVASEAIAEMVRQVGEVGFTELQNGVSEPGSITRGVIVRHLLLPGNVRDSKRVVKYLWETYGDRIYMSLMCQYTPLPHVGPYPELCRKVTEEEYDELVDFAVELGITQAYTQEMESAAESFIPDFEHFDLSSFLG